MEHKRDFFRDEVRCGFYVPTAIKQAWAAGLEVLAQIDRICEKHGITYYADWGTFLGAVRHGGFVPWDDDLDICMRRDDYQRFRAVADEELPKEYCIHDYERQEDHWLFLARVVQSRRICFDEEHLKKYHNFPWICGVDIFLQDYLYRDEEQEKKRCRDLLRIIAIADGVVGGGLSERAILSSLDELNKRYSVRLPDPHRRRELAVALYRLAEEQMSKVRPEESDTLGQMYPWILKGGKGQPKAYYEKTVRLPFEDTTIPVPAYYNSLLKARYGNYLEIRKVWTGHDYPFFEAERADMERVAGAPLARFCFQAGMLDRPAVDRSSSLKTTVSECIQALKTRQEEAKQLVNPEGIGRFGELLADCQQIAVDLGNLIEQAKGADSPAAKAVVRALEEYCEALYQSSRRGDPSGLDDALRAGEESIQKWILDRREILFLPIGAKEWNGFAGAYENARKEEDADVYVLPLPLLFKDPLGRIDMTEEEILGAADISEYPGGIEYGEWTCYDVSWHCPDVVYIQNPYDGENPCLTVPPDFYAVNLRKYTDSLIFVPFADTAEFGAEDWNDRHNMKYYVTAPGVVYADRVLVQSENIREQYVEKLVEFAGEDTRGHWRERIAVRESPSRENSPGGGETRKDAGKRLLYCIGANELSEHRETLLDAVRERFETFDAYRESITVGLSFYPPGRAAWDAVDEELAAELFAVLDKATQDARYELCELCLSDAERITAEYDAYYGSPSPLVPAFMMARKPVMICDYG